MPDAGANNSAYEQPMRRALDLARKGTALASPNPLVGAVLIDDAGNEIAHGFHTYDGRKHAEVLAIEQAGSGAKGATLVLNLEPCIHRGRTGPCSAAVIEAGIRRVVVAMRDPNPQVSGQGLKELRDAGIEVMEGVLENEARYLNESFARYIVNRRPLVTLKSGMTLDGKIAVPPPERQNDPSPAPPGAGTSTSGWITSDEARAHVQKIRHASDAIMVGVGTILADNPLLTDRTGLNRRRPLLRVVFDSRLRMPLDSRIVTTAREDVLVFCAFAEERKKRELEMRGVRVEQLPVYAGSEINISGGPPIKAADGRPDMRALVRRLGELEITSLLIEGGALINWSALASGIVDKVFLFYAPKILAGTGAVPFATGEGFHSMQGAAGVHNISLHRFGEDFAVEGYLRDPYESTHATARGPQLVTTEKATDRSTEKS